jgi:leucyl aminopeptidase
MFDFNFQLSKNKISFNDYSLVIRFLVDDENLKKNLNDLDKIYNLSLSEIQKENLLSKDITQIRVPTKFGKPDEIIIHKIKIDDNFNQDYFRNYFSELVQKISNEKINSIHIFIPKFKFSNEFLNDKNYLVQTFIEGFYLGNYSFNKYKSDKKSNKNLNNKLDVIIYSEDEDLKKDIIKSTEIVMEAVYFARDLQNEPSNELTPDDFVKIVKSKAINKEIKIISFDEKEIVKREMFGLYSVGKGSVNKPRFLVMEYKPDVKKSKKPKLKKIALVGKGMTFDSGGISLKPSKSMGDMKNDMAGASVVAAVLLAASELKLPIHLFGIIPLAENMPSGSAFKPGDIIRTSSGKTIEIEDTDAEGRVILSDALHYASKLNPDQIIDFATLTGSVVVALGEFVAGLFTKDDKLADDLLRSGIKTYERVWRLPLWDDYNKLIESDVADVKNLGIRWAGSITAAKFLEKFVDKKIKWAHLDIAGPSIHHNFRSYTNKYMTGFGVRLILNYLNEISI